MITWHYIVIGLSLVLLIFLVGKELARVNRARLLLRIAAVVLTVAALACLALPLYYNRKPAVPPAAGEGVLLTEGADPDSVRQFLQTAPAGTGTWSRGGVGAVAQFSKLHVFGYGLKREEWKNMQGLPLLVFHPPLVKTGLLAVGWNGQMRPGNKLRIQGQIVHDGDNTVMLQLVGVGSLLDSMVIKQGGANFELHVVPPQSGRAVYHLLILSGSDTLEKESLPVEVLPAQNLKILFLAASPDFENRFLESFLASKGHGLAVRTAISKGRSDEAWLNMPRTSLDHLSAALLDKFDVVIADAAELQAIGPGETYILRRQVAEKGLGLIIKADSSGAAAFYKDLFPMAGAKDSAGHPYIKDRSGTQPLLRDSLSRTLVSKGLYGSGKLVFTTLTSTYSRMLAGDQKEYAAFWSSVLGTVSRDETAMSSWRFFPDRPGVDDPVRVLLQANEPGLSQGQMDESILYFNQHPILPFYREGRYWPERAGWQLARGPQGDSTWWYAWGAGDWKNLRREERRRETLQFIREQGTRRKMGTAGGKGEAAEGKTGAGGGKVEGVGRTGEMTMKESRGGGAERALIAKGWFYIIFLICWVFLWVERKI